MSADTGHKLGKRQAGFARFGGWINGISLELATKTDEPLE